MTVQMALGVVIAIIGIIIALIILMPIFTLSQRMVPESFSSLDCISGYTKLQSTAAAISPYIMTASRGLRGELMATQGRWYITAKSIVCESVIGENFMGALVESKYLEKHADECMFPSACVSLGNCVKGGKTILVPGINEEQKKAVMEVTCLDCLQVANYLLRKNQYMAKQAEVTHGELTVGWTQFPP